LLERLRESHQRVESLFDAGFEGIALHDGGIVRQVNGALGPLLGYSKDELIGQHLLSLFAPEERATRLAFAMLDALVRDDAYHVWSESKLTLALGKTIDGINYTKQSATAPTHRLSGDQRSPGPPNSDGGAEASTGRRSLSSWTSPSALARAVTE